MDPTSTASPRFDPEGPAAPPPKSRVRMALVCLHVSALLYLLFGLGLAMFVMMNAEEIDSEEEFLTATGFSVCLFAFCAALAAGVEVVAYGVHKRQFWGWIAGLVVFGVYTSSAFLPLGALGLWGLLAAGSREEFGIERRESGRNEGRTDGVPGL